MLQAGCILENSYQLERVLGQNASRQTWLARDLQTQELVVIKLLPFNDQVQWDDLRLFEREAQVLQQLNHPNIPRYRNYFCVDDRLLWFGLVQEYVRGVSLKDLLNQGIVLTESEARLAARQVLKILIYLHELSPPVSHRDIKPSNLIRDEEGHIVLVDFGAVQDRAAKEGATFTVVGTYGYAPLEQLGGRATPASDLYALGATLIHLLTGIAPADLPQHDARLQFAHLLRINPGFARWLQALIEPNQSQRLSHARQALAALEANECAIAPAASLKPTNSRIQVKKTPQRLEILIPNTWRKFISPLGLLAIISPFLVLRTAAHIGEMYSQTLLENIQLFFVIFPYLFILLSMGSDLLGGSRITFDHRQFTLEFRLFGKRLRRQRGQISEINQVQVSALNEDFWSSKSIIAYWIRTLFSHCIKHSDKTAADITLAAGIREYPLSVYGSFLTQAECHWLAEEIQQWLGLSEIVMENRKE